MNPQAGTSLHTIRNATPQDAALFGSLWIELHVCSWDGAKIVIDLTKIPEEDKTKVPK